MIVVTIELWPRGDRQRAQRIGSLMIANDTTGTLSSGNYTAHLAVKGRDTEPGWWRESTRTWKAAAIRGFPRKRLGPYDLLYRVLQATVGSRNP